jgi:hypothetical protein
LWRPTRQFAPNVLLRAPAAPFSAKTTAPHQRPPAIRPTGAPHALRRTCTAPTAKPQQRHSDSQSNAIRVTRSHQDFHRIRCTYDAATFRALNVDPWSHRNDDRWAPKILTYGCRENRRTREPHAQRVAKWVARPPGNTHLNRQAAIRNPAKAGFYAYSRKPSPFAAPRKLSNRSRYLRCNYEALPERARLLKLLTVIGCCTRPQFSQPSTNHSRKYSPYDFGVASLGSHRSPSAALFA